MRRPGEAAGRAPAACVAAAARVARPARQLSHAPSLASTTCTTSRCAVTCNHLTGLRSRFLLCAARPRSAFLRRFDRQGGALTELCMQPCKHRQAQCIGSLQGWESNRVLCAQPKWARLLAATCAVQARRGNRAAVHMRVRDERSRPPKCIVRGRFVAVFMLQRQYAFVFVTDSSKVCGPLW